MNRKLLKILCAVFLVAVLTVCAVTPLVSKADMVEIESGKDIDLVYHSIDGRFNPDVWKHEGSLTTDSKSKYILKSNGWAQWQNADNLAFAYKKIAFNYSKKAQITAETTMTFFDGASENAGAGIMFRNGLEPDSSCIMFHYRPNSIMVTYRIKDGSGSSQGKTVLGSTKGAYPVTFKLVLIKGQNKATCYYKVGNSNYLEYATVPFTYSDTVYAGISSYSQDKNHMSTAKFSSFSYLVEAPEGYTVEGDNTTSAPEEEKIELPEDIPVAGNTLMRETFTDGSLTNQEETNQNDVINPIWKGEPNNIEIVVDEPQTNRYAYEYMKDESFYYAGDQSWTDYRTSYRLNFTREYSEDEANEFYAFVRTTDIIQYGYQYYCVKLTLLPKKNQIKFSLMYTDAYYFLTGTPGAGENAMYLKELESVVLDYETDSMIDKWHTLTVDSFDNIFTVYWGDDLVFKYKDNTSAFVHAKGCVGFGSNGAAVMVDDITVTKLEDLLGGDYDNRIVGNWNEEPPAYLDRFEELEADY